MRVGTPALATSAGEQDLRGGVSSTRKSGRGGGGGSLGKRKLGGVRSGSNGSKAVKTNPGVHRIEVQKSRAVIQPRGFGGKFLKGGGIGGGDTTPAGAGADDRSSSQNTKKRRAGVSEAFPLADNAAGGGDGALFEQEEEQHVISADSCPSPTTAGAATAQALSSSEGGDEYGKTGQQQHQERGHVGRTTTVVPADKRTPAIETSKPEKRRRE